MESYSQIVVKEHFDWNHFLQLKVTEIDSDQMEDAAEKAYDWVTCAVGTQCKVIPRTTTGRPKDDTLRLLGTQFAKEVGSMVAYLGAGFDTRFYTAQNAAINLLHQIEKRSAELITEINQNEKENN